MQCLGGWMRHPRTGGMQLLTAWFGRALDLWDVEIICKNTPSHPTKPLDDPRTAHGPGMFRYLYIYTYYLFSFFLVNCCRCSRSSTFPVVLLDRVWYWLPTTWFNMVDHPVSSCKWRPYELKISKFPSKHRTVSYENDWTWTIWQI